MNIDRFPVPLACCERQLNSDGLPDETVKGFRVTVDVDDKDLLTQLKACTCRL